MPKPTKRTAKRKVSKRKPSKNKQVNKTDETPKPTGPLVSGVLDDQLSQFIHWVSERHSIYLKRKAGEPFPWTNDMRLQFGFFTNPFREHDKTTQWFRENVREDLRDEPGVIFATLLFRRFNLIRTGEVCLKHNLFTDWNPEIAYTEIKKLGTPYLSAAYVMSAPAGSEKLQFFCRNVTHYWRDSDYLLEEIQKKPTLRHSHRIIKDLPYVGAFSGYEIVSDLRHTYLLEEAPDILTWASFGPGAKKGFNRLMFGGEKAIFEGNIVNIQESDRLEVAGRLLTYLRQVFDGSIQGPDGWSELEDTPEFEMRELEHSLCEFDKYMDMVEGGRPKRWYDRKRKAKQ